MVPAPSPKWLLASDADHLAREAAKIVMESVASAVAARKVATVAVSGGSTPKKLFETLADEYHKSRIAWDRLHIFFVDERGVPPNHADSNYGMAKAALFSKVPLPESNIHRMTGEMLPPAEAAKAYESTLRASFKVDKSIPVFDLILLGLGEDGHTASIFPKMEALEETAKWVMATYVEKLKSNRLTLTFPVLNAARRAIFLVAGKSKAPVLKDILTQGPSRYPAQRVNLTTGELIWMFDQAAASELPPDVRFKALHLVEGKI